MSQSRRDILKGLVGTAALTLSEVLGCASPSPPPPLEGSLIDGSTPRGHALWNPPTPGTGPKEQIDVVIIGGGAAGLSAGWRFQKGGLSDFAILELEDQFGGNAAWGQGPVTQYPWGAHYLTAPPPEAKATRMLLEELGAITHYDRHGRPQFNEDMTCYAPDERIFYRGEWFPGVYLKVGASRADLQEWARFEALVNTWRYHRGQDGRRAFTLPIAASSQDPAILALDTLTFADYLTQAGFTGERFWWMITYATRDDYCSLPDQISAWAGLHYYCSRCLHSDVHLDEDPPTLTWPEGNGFLMKGLAAPLKEHIRPGQLAFDLRPQGEGVHISALNVATGGTYVIEAKRAIFCGPRFLARRLIAPYQGLSNAGITYGPWLVANLHVKDRLRGRGAPPAWDNVLYHGRGVGYVAATHQAAAYSGPSVLTYYLPFSSNNPKAEAATLLKAQWSHWRDFILQELSPAHPDLQAQLTRLDVKRYGHAMVRPSPGRLWGPERQQELGGRQGIFLAHSDLSLPLFEEAQDQGVRAAEGVLQSLGAGGPSIRGLGDV